MNERTTWVRRRVCVALLLVAVGLHGCGSPDAGQAISAPDVDQVAPPQDAGPGAPAHDDFRYAHVLASGYQLSEEVMTSASADASSGWAPEPLEEADNTPDTQQTHSGKKRVIVNSGVQGPESSDGLV